MNPIKSLSSSVTPNLPQIFFRFFLWHFVLVIVGIVCSSTTKQKVLILDLDGTLYDDDCGIEQQIQDGCHKFSSRYNYSPESCEEMHKTFGATIRGIIEKGEPQEIIADYYSEAYPYIDMSKLSKYAKKYNSLTGYSFDSTSLHSLSKLKNKLILASNSPVFHVKRVLTRLGLNNLKFDSYFTPERMNGILKSDPKFWNILLKVYPQDKYDLTLIDDNGLNIQIVKGMGLAGIRITPKKSFSEALLTFLEIFPSCNKYLESFTFEEDSYLKAKNKIEKNTYNKEVFARLGEELIRLSSQTHKHTESTEIRVCDLGAGGLSMLTPILDLLIQKQTELNMKSVKYIAFESNLSPSILNLCHSTLLALNLYPTSTSTTSDILQYSGVYNNVQVEVHLLPVDFLSDEKRYYLHHLLGQGSSAK
eukprot:gene8297-17058_t